MLDKRRVLIITVFIVLVIIVIGTFLVINNVSIENEMSEYTPAEEITDAQTRQTMVTLYFKSGDKLEKELRKIDVKELINNPYETIVKMLIDGPKNEELEGTIMPETKINKIEKIGEELIIDFSKEFVEDYIGNEKEQKLTIESIVKTLTELTEINEIQIKINGEENISFNGSSVKFNKVFTRDSI